MVVYVETSAYRNSELIIKQLTLRIFRETCQPVVSAAATTGLNADALVGACLCGGGHVLFGEFVVVVGVNLCCSRGMCVLPYAVQNPAGVAGNDVSVVVVLLLSLDM